MKKNQEQRRVKSLLRVGDTVMVIAGGNKTKKPIKGQVGRILGFRGADRVIVEGLNMQVGYRRASGPMEQGGRVVKESPMHISNVMFYVADLQKPVRLKTQIRLDGTKVRGYLDPSKKEFIEVSTK